MRDVLIIYTDKMITRYQALIKMIRQRFNSEEICIRSGASLNEYALRLSRTAVDYICTLDMAGFEISTLLDCPIYNILAAKQIHIIIDESVLQLYGKKEFALNLFLYVPGNAIQYRRKYPHIPYIEEYRSFETDESGNILESAFNQNILNTIIDRAIQEAEG